MSKIWNLYNPGDNFTFFMSRISPVGLLKLKTELEQMPNEIDKLNIVVAKIKERPKSYYKYWVRKLGDSVAGEALGNMTFE